jgi:hypothetical protein
MTFLLSALGFGKSVMDAILGWLSRQSPATLLCAILCVALLIDHAALLMAHRHSAKVEKQLSASVAQVKQLNASLEAISTKKNEQQVITKTNIVTVTKTIHDAEKKAEVVEKAPPAPGCKTKPEILGADL